MLVVPEAAPLLKVRVSKPKVLVPCVAIKETSPVAWGEVGEIEALTLIGAPCVILIALPPLSVRVVVDGLKITEFQLLTRLLAFTEPRPVAKSYPAPAL